MIYCDCEISFHHRISWIIVHLYLLSSDFDDLRDLLANVSEEVASSNNLAFEAFVSNIEIEVFIGLRDVERSFNILSSNSAKVSVNIDLEIADLISVEEVYSLILPVKEGFLLNNITILFVVEANFNS